MVKRSYGRRRRNVRRRLGARATGTLARLAVGAAAAYFGSRNVTKKVPPLATGARRRGPIPRVRLPMRSGVASRTRRRYKVKSATTGVGGQIRFRKSRFGRTKRLTLKRVERLLSNSTLWRYQFLNKLNNVTGTACPGRHIMYCYADPGTATSTAPVHLYELTCYSNTGNPAVGKRLEFTDQGTASFWDQAGQGPDGSTVLACPWQFEAADTSNVVKAKYVKHDWYDIRLMLHGCTTQPTYYDVMVVSFQKDYLDPLENVTDPLDLRYRSAFWQNMARSLVTNPINIGNAESSMRGMRVLRRYRTVIQPSLDTELDTNPECVSHKIFMKDGRTRSYDYGGEPITTDTGIFNIGFKVEELASANYQNHPRPGARVWLMIRASNTTSVLPVESTRANTPSYDICMRRRTTITNNS